MECLNLKSDILSHCAIFQSEQIDGSCPKVGPASQMEPPAINEEKIDWNEREKLSRTISKRNKLFN
jgi:hypothetical protein